jgi:3-oxoadipate enol-lactonase
MPDALVNGVRIGYGVTGEPGARPMVLLHGGGNDRSSWALVLPALSRDHRVYALDLRGFGESGRPAEYSFELMRDDVTAFLDLLALEQAVLIGHSMGGNVALLVAEEQAGRLTHLVVEDTAPPRVGDAAVSIPPRPDEPLPFDYDALAAVIGQLNDPDPAWWDRATAITVPTLIIAGGPDSHVDQERLGRLAGLLPAVRLATIPVGHRVHQDAPDAFVAAVTAFLRSS